MRDYYDADYVAEQTAAERYMSEEEADALEDAERMKRDLAAADELIDTMMDCYQAAQKIYKKYGIEMCFNAMENREVQIYKGIEILAEAYGKTVRRDPSAFEDIGYFLKFKYHGIQYFEVEREGKK